MGPCRDLGRGTLQLLLGTTVARFTGRVTRGVEELDSAVLRNLG